MKYGLSIFRKSVDKTLVSLKSDKNNGYFTWRPIYIFNQISLNSSYKRNISRKSCSENQTTHFMFNYFFSKIMPFMRYCGKYCTAGRATDNSTARAHAYWIPKATNTICNTCRFSTATMVAQTRLIVAFYVHCLSCLILPTFCKQSTASKLKLAGVGGGSCGHEVSACWNVLIVREVHRPK